MRSLMKTERKDFPSGENVGPADVQTVWESVSIPLIEEMALFIKECVSRMENEFSDEEKERYKKSGVTLKMKAKVQEALKDARTETIEKCDRLISEISVDKEFARKT